MSGKGNTEWFGERSVIGEVVCAILHEIIELVEAGMSVRERKVEDRGNGVLMWDENECECRIQGKREETEAVRCYMFEIQDFLAVERVELMKTSDDARRSF
eukprot:752278-Hanusia_phi.AAC.2